MTDARCWNCRHWQGDREAFEAWRRGIEVDHGPETLAEDMDPRKGWAPRGECDELRVHLDVYYIPSAGFEETPETPAGLYCNLHEPTETDDAP